MKRQTDYEAVIRADLATYLRGRNEVDAHLPDAPDIEGLWQQIGEAYLPDAMREFDRYPTVALGWIMYVGMAVAACWDEDWERWRKVGNLYAALLAETDFDHLDDHIREKVLGLDAARAAALEDIVGHAAARVCSLLRRLRPEPGTEDAFRAFVAALHQMYLMGAAMQLRRMGYHMTRLGR